MVPLKRIHWSHTKIPDDRFVNKKFLLSKRAVRKIKDKAQACVAVGGGVFEGRKL